MQVRFSMNELMKGTHHFVVPSLGSAEEQDFYFRITWGQAVPDFFNPLSPSFFSTTATGVIFVKGLTDREVPCEGTLELRYFNEQKLRYTLSFSYKGEKYTYVGEKTNVKLWRPLCLVKTHTTCYGILKDSSGTIISKSITHFEIEPEVIFNFVTSFRLALQ